MVMVMTEMLGNFLEVAEEEVVMVVVVVMVVMVTEEAEAEMMMMIPAAMTGVSVVQIMIWPTNLVSVRKAKTKRRK